MEHDCDTIGALGENAIERWALRSGIVANKSQRDKCGWDYVFQYQLAREALLLPGCGNLGYVTCFAQVKTTAVHARRSSVRLSNWARAANEPILHFFIVLELDAQDEVEGAFFVHVDRLWVEKVNERLWKMDSAELAEINKRYMDLTWTDDDRIDPSEANAVRNSINRILAPDPLAYAITKAGWINTGGFTTERPVGVLPDHQQPRFAEELARFSVGLVDELEFHAKELRVTRYGETRTIVVPPDATVRARRNTARVKDDTYDLTFSGNTTQTVVHITCDAFASASEFPDLPDGAHITRLEAPYVQIILRSAGLDATLDEFVWEEPVSVVGFAKATGVLRVLSDTGGSTVEIHLSDSSVVRFSMPDHGTIDRSLADLAEASDNAAFLCLSFGLPSLQASPISLLANQRSFSLHRIATDPTAAGTSLEIEVSVPEPIGGGVAVMPLFLRSTVGATRLVTLVGFFGVPTVPPAGADQGLTRIRYITFPRVLQRWRLSGTEEVAYEEELSAWIQRLEDDRSVDSVIRPEKPLLSAHRPPDEEDEA